MRHRRKLYMNTVSDKVKEHQHGGDFNIEAVLYYSDGDKQSRDGRLVMIQGADGQRRIMLYDGDDRVVAQLVNGKTVA